VKEEERKQNGKNRSGISEEVLGGERRSVVKGR